MTKRNLWLLSLLLVLGLAVTASSTFAQTTWGVSSTKNAGMRTEGDAEGTGFITLTLTSAGTIYSGTKLFFTYNTPLQNISMAAAAVESAVDVTCTGTPSPCGYITAFGTNSLSNSTVQTAPYTGTTDPPNGGAPLDNQVYLLFTTTGPVSLPATINVSVRSTVQGYPSAFPVATTVKAQSPSGTPTLFYIGTGTPGSNPTPSTTAFQVGTVNAPQALTVAIDDGPAQVLTCIGVKRIEYYDEKFSIRFTENFANALTSLSDEWALENDTLTGAPTNGSNILVTFNGIPPGLKITETDVYSDCGTYTSGAHGCPGGLLNVTYTTSSGAPSNCSGTPSTCSQSFLFTVNKTNTAVKENGVLKFVLNESGPLQPNNNYQIQATVSLTDALVPDVPPDMPWFSENESPTMSIVEFSDCVTNLLFPYINTFQGALPYPFSHFGTGISFANTTWDPFGLNPATAKGSAVPQSGNCTVYYYPANEGTTLVYTTPTISAGGSYSFDVATGAFLTVPNCTTGGCTGYAIAICQFQNAYGIAEIYDNFGGTQGILTPASTLAYLAYIIPNPAFYHRSPAGGGLGEEAIAPYNLNHGLVYCLLYGCE